MRVEVGEVGGLLGVAAEVVQGHLGSDMCIQLGQPSLNPPDLAQSVVSGLRG